MYGKVPQNQPHSPTFLHHFKKIRLQAVKGCFLKRKMGFGS